MTRRTALIWVAVCALLLALYALAGFVLLPYGIERYATRYVAEQLGAELTLGDTDFNPFLLRFEAEGLRLSKPGKLPNSQEPPPPMLALERLVVDLDWSSLWHSPWTVSEFGLYGVRWHGQIGPDGRLDWAALTNDTGGGEAGSPPQWQVEHVVVRDGRLTLVDLRGATPASAVLGNVEISARDLATFQREGGPRGHYQLSAAFATGGTLRGQGSLTLTPALHSRGQWALADVKLPAIWPLLSSAIGLDLDPVAATLSASSNYVYSTSDAKSASRSVAATSGPIFELDALALRLDDVALRASESERALLRLKTLSADGGRVDLATRDLSFAQISLGDGAVLVNVDQEGRLGWQALGKPTAREDSSKRAPDDAGATGTARPWHLRTALLRVDDVALHAADHSRPLPLALDVAAIDGQTALALEIGAGSAPLRLRALSAQLGGVRLSMAEPADAVAPADAAEPLLAFDALTLSGAGLDSAARRIEIDSIVAQGGHVALDLGDTPGLVQALRGDTGSSAPAPRNVAATESPQPAWNYAIDTLSIAGTDLLLRHHGFEPAINYRAEVTRATLGNVASPATAPMQLDVELNLADGGTLRAEGTMAQDLASAALELQIDRLPLLPLQPLLAQWARLELRSGVFSTHAQLALRRAEDGSLALHATGNASLHTVRLDEAASGERLLAWKLMQAEGVIFDTAPASVKIARIELQEPGAKLVIAKDRSVNLSDVIRTDGGAAANGLPRQGQAAEAMPRQERAAPFKVAIGRVDARDGVLEFSDLSLVLPFSTRITRLQGSVVNIATGSERARVQATGEIGKFGSARVTGSLLPFAPKRFLDLNVVMDNVAVPPFSPYTATFAGRKVAEGKLWLDLEYHIEDGELLGDNEIRLADFRLGERVDAPNALDLPLDLAVALLTDSEGNIELSVPVRGDIGKPTVDVATLVREAFASVLKRIVTAPFRALGRLFGGGDDDRDLARIEFAPGSDVLPPPQREKLEAVGRALTKRPQLQLVVPGPYAPELDAQMLRRLAVRRELARVLGEEVAPGSEPGLIAFADEATQRALEALLAKYAGDQALAELRAAPPPAAPPSPASTARQTPADAAQAPVQGLYAAVFARIVERYPLPDAALRLLASRRADAIRDYLVDHAGVPARRIGTGQLEAVKDVDDGAVSTTLELDAAQPSQPLKRTTRTR